MNLAGDPSISTRALRQALAFATGIGCNHCRSPGQAVGKNKLDVKQGHPGTSWDKWNLQGQTGTHISLSLHLTWMMEKICRRVWGSLLQSCTCA